MGKNIFSIIVVSLFALIAGFPLVHKGLPPTHDGEYHIVRFYQFYKTLADGSLYPRWAKDLNNGFGIPLFNYVYPLPNYIASFLHFLGISFIDAFKLELFLGLLLGGIFFYLYSREFWGDLGGLVCSVFYTFSPYHFVDIYIRGSVGEVWALAFFPAFLWSITRYIQDKQKIFFILSSLFLCLIIFSHNILALMFFPFAITYIIFLICKSRDKKYLILNTFYIILLSLGLSSIFWLPALFESHYVRGLQIFDLSRHFPDLYQLIVPSWGSGFSGTNSPDELSFQIGVANLLGLAISLLALIINLKKKNKSKGIIIFSFIWFIIVFLLMLKMSLFIWEKVPLMGYFQFAWRLLSLEILVTSFLAGSIVYFWKSKILAIFLIFLAFSLGIGYVKPAYYHYRDDNYYLIRSNFIDGTNSPGNVFNTIFFNTDLKKQKEKLSFIKGGGEVNQKVDKSTLSVFNIKADKDSEIEVNTAYFPRWIVKLDGEQISTKTTSSGLFSFYVPKGKHVVEVRFTDTLERRLGVFGFFLSSFVLIALSLKGLSATIKR